MNFLVNLSMEMKKEVQSKQFLQWKAKSLWNYGIAMPQKVRYTN